MLSVGGVEGVLFCAVFCFLCISPAWCLQGVPRLGLGADIPGGIRCRCALVCLCCSFSASPAMQLPLGVHPTVRGYSDLGFLSSLFCLFSSLGVCINTSSQSTIHPTAIFSLCTGLSRALWFHLQCFVVSIILSWLLAFPSSAQLSALLACCVLHPSELMASQLQAL